MDLPSIFFWSLEKTISIWDTLYQKTSLKNTAPWKLVLEIAILCLEKLFFKIMLLGFLTSEPSELKKQATWLFLHDFGFYEWFHFNNFFPVCVWILYISYFIKFLKQNFFLRQACRKTWLRKLLAPVMNWFFKSPIGRF